ncbi:hypothetical protein [Ligilactobacillus agilis]|uniref:hypothetical protein n=1 Tax=Ligilactobacillus agilis TaxID=1601 RepID=UPI000B8D4AB3|nr:hypothetical protein [Ligilactobacillus agilis]ASR40282.1 hypothetical protein BEN83_01575 [Ligilactobacillus agilis]
MDELKPYKSHFKKLERGVNNKPIIPMETYKGFLYYGQANVMVKTKVDVCVNQVESNADKLAMVDDRYFIDKLYSHQITLETKTFKNIFQVIPKGLKTNDYLKITLNPDSIIMKPHESLRELMEVKYNVDLGIEEPFMFAVNPVYVRDVLMLFSSLKIKNFKLKHTGSNLRPVMFEADDIQVVVAPVRLPNM